jgi:V/A-type H+-transporting ATPase subunit B
MNSGIGKGKTRDDHKDVSNQLYAGYAEGRELRGLVSIVGEEALSERDRRFLRFAEAFEDLLVRQGREENRSIEDTLDLGWKMFSDILDEKDLTRIDPEEIKKRLKK